MISFTNGDQFMGIFKDGRPNGYGEMNYKNSVGSTTPGLEYEMAQYKGQFRSGKREGKGKMIWADGSCFEGSWSNDLRQYGRMVMTNGCIYIGQFREDKFHGEYEKLLMPNMIIYQGKFNMGKTGTIGMILYPNGDIYYGQHN